MENHNSRRFPTDPTTSTAIIESELKKQKASSINKPFIISQLGSDYAVKTSNIVKSQEIPVMQ